VVRSHESEVASKHSNKYYRGYLIRYQFTKGNKIFLSVVRSHESEVASKHSNKYYRGYLIRYQFTKGNKIFLIEYFILYGRLLYGR